MYPRYSSRANQTKIGDGSEYYDGLRSDSVAVPGGSTRNTMGHKHHIVPRHMNGSDDPSNITVLTVKEHAEAHRVLFERYGYFQDYLAWQGLLKLKTRSEILTEFG